MTVDRVVQKNECQTCGTKDVVLKFAWNAKKKAMALRNRTVYTERTTATKLVSALKKKTTTTAKKYAAASVVSTVTGGSKYRLASCVTDSFGARYRTCTIEYVKNGQNAGAVLSMQHTGFGTWKAVKAKEFFRYA